MSSIEIFAYVMLMATFATVAIWALVIYFAVAMLWESARDAWRWWRA